MVAAAALRPDLAIALDIMVAGDTRISKIVFS